jgi:hypothetical protein
MPARTKGKWLTAHALRSGLAEQWATQTGGITVTVELRWVKERDEFRVMVMRGRQIDKLTLYPSLAMARQVFITEQRHAVSPRERNQP